MDEQHYRVSCTGCKNGCHTVTAATCIDQARDNAVRNGMCGFEKSGFKVELEEAGTWVIVA
jgi:hypothetical protein